MANLEKNEILDKVSKVENQDLKIELMEDITDSFEKNDETISKSLYDDLKLEKELLEKKYNDLQNKYITRFTDGGNSNKVNTVKEDQEEIKYVDVRSIFK